MENKIKQDVLRGAMSLVVLAGVVGVLFSIRHGLGAWSELLSIGWPTLLIAVLAGIVRGVVRAKWEQHYWLLFIVQILSFGLIVLLGVRLVLELAYTDVWAAMVVCVVYLGVYFVTWRVIISLWQRNSTPSEGQAKS